MRVAAVAAIVCLTIFNFSAVTNAQAAVRKQTNIPAQGLGPALQSLAKEHEFQIIYRSELLKELRTLGAAGDLTSDEALAQLLSGTGLAYRYLDEKTVTIFATHPGANEGTKRSSERRSVTPSLSELRIAQAAVVSAKDKAEDSARESEVSKSQDLPRPEESAKAIPEIVVTGTHIRGVTSSASPIQVYTRDDIERTGLGSVQEFVQRLPQNFKGGASEGTVGTVAGGGESFNQVGGTGINLRGLGNDSTLVLINGRRVAPGNTRGNWVDVSLIPLAAVERVELVPDGASAIYGSDAVGGVVNFVLRRDFEGAETRLRYGSGKGRAPEEVQVGQTLGHDWGSGSALLTYEYFDRTRLDASDRAFTQSAVRPFTLLPEQERHGAFLTINQQVTTDSRLFADGTFSQRSTVEQITNPFFTIKQPADIQNYSATLGGRVQLADRFGFELSTSYAASDTHFGVFFNGPLSTDRQVDTSLLSVDAKLDGSLWAAPAGSVLFALGGQYRDETFDSKNLLTGRAFRPRRDVIAAFLELQAPLVGPSRAAPTVKRLELVLAARSERYSDFGSSNNPKAGLIWQPWSGVKFRGTYGRSFKAPLLHDLNPIPSGLAAQRVFDSVTGADINVLVPFGGNPDLDPENATIWTLGIDLLPEGLPGLQANATYYDVRFKDRIASLSGATRNAIASESTLGPELIQRNPPLSLIQELIAATARFNDQTGIPGGVDLATIAAIVDFRRHNLSEVNTSGIDFGLSYTTGLALGKLEVGVEGTYILDFDRQFTSASPGIEVLNTPFEPVDLKLRGRGILQRGGLSAAVFINYVDSYTDDLPATIAAAGRPVPVKSWTTLDVNIGYELGADNGLLSDVSVALSAVNVTDEHPPFLTGEEFWPGVNFDGANANVLGRFVALQLFKRW